MPLAAPISAFTSTTTPRKDFLLLHSDYAMTVPFNNTPTLSSWLAGRVKHGLISNHFSTTKQQVDNLAEGSRKIQADPNAGGNSVWSEVLSFEVLHRLFNCQLLKTEMELVYFPYGSKITDYSVEVGGENIGVSVTRAMEYKTKFTLRSAQELLEKKLSGVLASSKAVLKPMRWKKQILHAWVQNAEILKLLQLAYDTLPEPLRADTLVICTLANEKVDFVFRNVDKVRL